MDSNLTDSIDKNNLIPNNYIIIWNCTDLINDEKYTSTLEKFYPNNTIIYENDFTIIKNKIIKENNLFCLYTSGKNALEFEKDINQINEIKLVFIFYKDMVQKTNINDREISYNINEKLFQLLFTMKKCEKISNNFENLLKSCKQNFDYFNKSK